MKIKITFKEPLLGTMSANKELATEFIAAKCKEGLQSDEIATIAEIPEAIEKQTTIFPADENGVFLWDYQVKGFLKDACLAMISTEQRTQKQLKEIGLTKYCYKRTFDQLVFVKPRKIRLVYSGKIGILERPLRGQTMQGERICLARSEKIEAGATCEIEIISLNENLWEMIKECLDYGQYRGLLQWRNAGYGSFEYQELQ
jgi:hypothetical protein